MTRLIGYRWKYSDVWSRVVLIARSLPQFFFIICLPQKVQSECFFLPTLSKKYSLFPNGEKTIKVVGGYSEGVHLFPFRTEKLSSSALMVLPYGGRVSRRQPKLKRSCINLQGLFFCPYLTLPNLGICLWPFGPWRHKMFYYAILVPGGIKSINMRPLQGRFS